jgi:rhodanese-related sulfurtransferase
MTDGSAIEARLAAARARLDRLPAAGLDEALAGDDLVVDLRPEASRRANGELPGAVVIERIHLEWRVDPTSPDRVPEALAGRRVVLVCNEGYSSSLAAADLLDLGVDATDVDGGYDAWAALRAADPG